MQATAFSMKGPFSKDTPTSIANEKYGCVSAVGIELKKNAETRHRWKNARRLFYICGVFLQMYRVVFLRSFIFNALFLYFFISIPTWNEILQKLFP